MDLLKPELDRIRSRLSGQWAVPRSEAFCHAAMYYAAEGMKAEYQSSIRAAIAHSGYSDSKKFNATDLYLLSVADALIGEHKKAEQRVLRLPSENEFRAGAFNCQAHIQAENGKVDEAKRLYAMSNYYQGTITTGFVIGKAIARHDKPSEAFFFAEQNGANQTAKLAIICGIVAGLRDDLPKSKVRHVPW